MKAGKLSKKEASFEFLCFLYRSCWISLQINRKGFRLYRWKYSSSCLWESCYSNWTPSHVSFCIQGTFTIQESNINKTGNENEAHATEKGHHLNQFYTRLALFLEHLTNSKDLKYCLEYRHKEHCTITKGNAVYFETRLCFPLNIKLETGGQRGPSNIISLTLLGGNQLNTKDHHGRSVLHSQNRGTYTTYLPARNFGVDDLCF